MSERRTIGRILIEAGRITEDDVERALEYQRDHGGYFGEALVASGLVSEEELEWGLASQFDLPYVFPDAEAIDLAAVALVSPEWALSHLALPIMRTDDRLQVIVDSPLKDEPVRELATRTGLEVELALASPGAIRDVIGQVFERLAETAAGSRAPVGLAGLLEDAIRVSAPSFGISVRGVVAHGWWEDRGTVHRRPLAGGWSDELSRSLAPSAEEMTVGTRRAEWIGELRSGGETTPVNVRYLADESGREYAFELRVSSEDPVERFGPVPGGIAAEVLALVHAGSARIGVRFRSPELARVLGVHLPRLLLGPGCRSIHLHVGEGGAEDDAFSLRIPAAPGQWAREAEALRPFRFDVASIDLGGATLESAVPLLEAARAVFLLLPDDTEAASIGSAGLLWTLDIHQTADGTLSWALDPLDG